MIEVTSTVTEDELIADVHISTGGDLSVLCVEYIALGKEVFKRIKETLNEETAIATMGKIFEELSKYIIKEKEE